MHDNLRTVETIIEINGYVPHEFMALAVIVEYEVGVPLSREATLNLKTMPGAIMQRDKIVTNIIVGACLFIPFDGQRVHLRTGSLRKSEYDSNPQIQLELRTDDICQVLSQNYILKQPVNDDNSSVSLIGFDAKMYDSFHHEIRHNDEIDEQTFDGLDGSDHAPMPSVSRSSVSRSVSKKEHSSRYEASEKQIDQKRQFHSSAEDNDSSSLADSIVSGNSTVSSLRLDVTKYVERTLRQKNHEVRTDTSSDILDAFKYPANKESSLLSRSLHSKIIRTKIEPAISGGDQIVDHTRELSRAARTRLNRHGFSEHTEQENAHFRQTGESSHPRKFSLDPVDITLETRDSLNINDVSVQFAGFRAISSEHTIYDERGRTPRAIYCSYQFYTFSPTRTEVMRLLPASLGQVAALAREEAHARDESPLALRYIIDPTGNCTSELYEFADYLANYQLNIDVWDADSLLLIGTCSVPLRKLMRQGQPKSSCWVESDIIDADIGLPSLNGITVSSIALRGPPVGKIVGSLNILLCNFGREGKLAKPITSSNDDDKFNWRAHGAALGSNVEKQSRNLNHRPKNIVRAKPLSESTPELSKALEDTRRSDIKGLSKRSLIANRGDESNRTLTHDEVIAIFRRFQAPPDNPGKLQYKGSPGRDLLTLLDVQSFSSTMKKCFKILKSSTDVNLKKVRSPYKISHFKITRSIF